MTAWAYTLAYNERLIIPYWVRHYRTFCERVIVYVDTDTDDGTEDAARAEGAEVRAYVGNHALDDVAFVAFAEEHYREARGRADWVIWTDADEIVYHPRMAERLDAYRAQGVNYPYVPGYCMVSYEPPTGTGQIYDEIRAGLPSEEYSKVCLFDPMLSVEWATGKHTANVTGQAVNRGNGSDPPKLLHYRWFGRAYFEARNQKNYARINEANKLRQHGKETYPGYSGKYSPQWFDERVDVAMPVI